MEGAHLFPNPGDPTHTAIGRRPALLPAGFWQRFRRPVQPERVQERGDHRRQQAPGRHLRGGRQQDAFHPGGHVPAGPRRASASAADQRGWNDRSSHRPRDGAHRRGASPGRQDPVGRSSVHRVHAGLRRLLLDRARPHHGRVQLGDIPTAGARARLRGRHGVQPRYQRRDLHDLPVPLEGYHHRRQLLPLLRHRRGGVGFLLHVPSGDPRSYAGGDGQAVRHARHRHGSSRRHRCQGEGGGNAHHVDGRKTNYPAVLAMSQ